MKVEYNSNNSGGSWWLSDENWKALEVAGWHVNWYSEEKEGPFANSKKDGRFLGALASSAYKEGVSSIEEAVEEWERVTGANSTDAGCPCCGQPHSFTLYDDDGNYKDSGPRTSYEVSW